MISTARFVVGIGESRDEHAAIGDVKVRVARRQNADLRVPSSFGIGSSIISSGFTIDLHRAQPPQIFLQRFVIHAVGSSSTTARTVRCVDEAREIIDVTVGVVAFGSAAQPEDFAHAEKIAETVFNF